MPLFRRKHDSPAQPPLPPHNKQCGSLVLQDVDSPRARSSISFQDPLLSAPPNSPRTPALNRSPHVSAPRSILRNSCIITPQIPDMSQTSHATLLLASSANMNGLGSISFLPASNSASAIPSGFDDRYPTLRSGAQRIDGLPTSTSLPQIDPRTQVFPVAAVSPHDTSMFPNPYPVGYSPANVQPARGSVPFLHPPPRGSVSSQVAATQYRAPPFPFPTEAAALHTLARVLRTETKKFRITDFIDIEEGEFAALVEAREAEAAGELAVVDSTSTVRNRRRIKSMWDGEEEDETVTDCVRDKMGEEGASKWKAERTERSEKRRQEREMRLKDLHLFGTHLEDLPDSALAPVVVGGYLHEVPTVVGACIEELIRSRLSEPKFFDSRPDRKQLFDLVARFDRLVRANAAQGQMEPPQSLREEATETIYPLLVTYLSALPHTVIPRPLVDAFWCWCVSPSVIRQAQRSRIRREEGEDDSESEREASDSDDDAPTYSSRLRQRERDFLDLPSFRVQIRIARHLLLLLSRRQFSLFVYLMHFIRAVLHPDGDSDREEGDRTSNGVALHDVARRFGGVILGGKDWKRRGSIKRTREDTEDFGDQGKDRTTKEQKIMTWLVNHWGRIASAYETDEDIEPTSINGPRPRAGSLPVRPQGIAPQTGPFVPPRSRASTVRPLDIKARRPSQCESLTSGSTASSSEWEELPVVSVHNGPIPPKSKSEKIITQLNKAPTVVDDSSGDEANGAADILEYYCSRDKPSEAAQLSQQVDCCSDADDDVSIYSCDVVALAPTAHDPGCEGTFPDNNPQLRTDVDVSETDNLRLQLNRALHERDEARKLVDAMRSVIVGSAPVS